MTFNADLIGKRYPEVSVKISAEEVAAFADAIGERAPVFLDPVAAAEQGYPAQVAPPTIVAVLQIVAVQEITSDPDIGTGFDGIVHGEQVYEWVRPVYVGDELTTVPIIDDIRSRAGVSFMDVLLDVHDAEGLTVLRSKSTLVHFQGES